MNQLPSPPPHLLLVEDDPVSAAFLHTAATAFPATVVVAGTLAAAEQACIQQPFDLLLIDANLPDGRGDELLQRLRQRGIHTPALAHTAAATTASCATLQACGFIETLSKPIPVAGLHAALQRHLPAALQPPELWNDATALAALGGNPDHVTALRALFLKELPDQQARIRDAANRGDAAAVRAELHKLSASCGFVGAAHLAQAVQALRADPLDRTAVSALDTAITHTLAS
ncbi:MAG: hypothetical protein RLY77_1314 [Pseudomonadota bacterium]|jgi:DNA-binding response OmpR family regulator